MECDGDGVAFVERELQGRRLAHLSQRHVQLVERAIAPVAPRMGFKSQARCCSCRVWKSRVWLGKRRHESETVVLYGGVLFAKARIAFPFTGPRLPHGQARNGGDRREETGAASAPKGLPSIAQVAGDAVAFDLGVAVVEDMDGRLPSRCIQGSEEIPQGLEGFVIAFELQILVQERMDGGTVVSAHGCFRTSMG